MKIPDMPRDGVTVESTVKDIIKFIRASRVVNVVGGRIKTSPNGTTLEIKPGKGKGGTASGDCPFGEIITIPDTLPEEQGIRGGIIHCGDQNFNMDPQPLNLAVSGSWLVSIAVDCVANTDDDGTLLLPGIKTGTRPSSWTQTVWASGADYPPNTIPTLPSGAGTIVLPIGHLIITGGVATLAPAGCGNFSVNHCAGTLSYSRA